jgi:hypothetical protein
MSTLSPTIEELRAFIGSGDIDKESVKSLLTEVYPTGSIVSNITMLYLDGKLPYLLLEKGLRRVILNMRLSESNAFEIFLAVIILADSRDLVLAGRSQRIIKSIVKRGWYGPNPKDNLRFIEHKGKQVTWYRSWISRDGPARLRKWPMI